MKRLIAYLLLICVVLIGASSCSTGYNGVKITNSNTHYQKKNLSKFGKKKRHKKDGSKYHPAVRPQDRGK